MACDGVFVKICVLIRALILSDYAKTEDTLSNTSFRTTNAALPVKLPDNDEIPLSEVLPSNSGYLIRPYVDLCGQTKGYLWGKGKHGLWRQFLSSHIKNYTLGITGTFVIYLSNNFILTLSPLLFVQLENRKIMSKY